MDGEIFLFRFLETKGRSFNFNYTSFVNDKNGAQMAHKFALT